MTSAGAIGAVRWGVVAFHANPDAGDAELTEILAAAGVPRAGHVVAMLPLAYGRRIIEGLVTLPTTFCEVDDAGAIARETELAADPIFAAADRLARSECTRADLDRIGLHSSEVNALNNALHKGADPKDLVVSPPMMQLGPDDPPGTPPLADAQAMVDELVQAHPVAGFALEARVFPGKLVRGHVQLQLDIVARIGERPLIESFAGMGATIRAAYADAINKFARGSLHVELAALVAREHGADQVEWETWGDFDACLGPLLRMWTDKAPGLGDYLDTLKTALLAGGLAPVIHGVRTFVACDADGKILAFDMLVDNDSWPPGVAIVERWPWPAVGVAYALRHFFILVPR